MNIVDFLIANYHWILAIILLTIITIIGFLADKKKNDKKKENTTPMPPQNNNNMTIKQQPMQYQPEIQNQMDHQQNMMSNNNMNNINNGAMNQNLNINQMGNGMINQPNDNQSMGTIPQPMISPLTQQNNNNQMNNPQPVENIAPKEMQEPMYQTLDEQKPHFAPQPIPNFDTIKEMQSESSQMMNNQMPLGNTNIMNQQPMIQVIPQPTQYQPEIQNQTNPQQMSNYNQNINMQDNNNYGIPNVIPNQGTIPQPVNPIPNPQPVIPQPIMTNQMTNPEPMGQMSNYNMNQPLQNQNGFTGNQMRQNMMQQNSQPMNMQQQMQKPISPINFVYGPQNNNNQNM